MSVRQPIITVALATLLGTAGGALAGASAIRHTTGVPGPAGPPGVAGPAGPAGPSPASGITYCTHFNADGACTTWKWGPTS